MNLLDMNRHAIRVFALLLEIRRNFMVENTVMVSDDDLSTIKKELESVSYSDYKGFSFIRILKDAKNLKGAIEIAILDLEFELGGEDEQYRF